jgi:ribosomal protein L11 methyltransferase
VSWLAVSVRSNDSERAAVVSALFAAGSRAVEEAGEELKTYFPIGTDLDPIIRAVSAVDASARVATSEVVVGDWNTTWRERLTVQRAGRFAVTPPWLAENLDPASTIIIDPGMAFGTGDHATTRGALRLLADVVRPGDRVADLGAGSGVLSIAAAKRGAANVAAIEVDPDAIGNAEANVRANGVSERVAVLLGDAAILLPLVAPVRVVLANIVAPVLLSLLPLIADALTEDGRAVVGGITNAERVAFVSAVRKAGWRIEAEDREDAWWSAVIARQ